MNKKETFLKLIIGAFITIVSLIGLTNRAYAENMNFNNIKTSEDLKNYLSTATNVKQSEIVELYTELTEKFSNKDIANMVEENKEIIIEKSGLDEEILTTSTDILRSLNTEETKKILEEDLNIEEIKEKLNNGYTIEEIVKEIQNEMPVSKMAAISIKLLLASSIVKTILLVSIGLTVYMIVIRWVIFKKAGKHGWASIIPIYNKITYLKVCGISPWWLLILLIPIFGWIIYGILQIVSRFTLAYSFKRGTGFGFGLLFLAIIFESILAFNKNIQYSEEE